MKQKTKQKIKKIETELKKEIKEDFLNVPNCITLARMILLFFVVYMIFNGYSSLSIAIVFAIAASTDWFDGYFARKLKQTTNIGARLDQITDRIFTIIIVIALLIYFNSYRQEKIFLLFLVCSREIIGSFGFVIRLIINKDAYKVRYIGKITTFVQSVAIAWIIAGFPYDYVFATITCIFGIVAGIDYLRDSVK